MEIEEQREADNKAAKAEAEADESNRCMPTSMIIDISTIKSF